MKPKYAIVRVDNKCPEYTEEDFECPFSNDKIECEICRQGRYGDTKEQLIRKVAQVIKRYRVNLEICEYCDMADEFEIAEKVVEFLGVK